MISLVDDPMTMTTTPDWLMARGGELRSGIDEHIWLVLLNGSPHYRLTITPAKNQFTCAVSQTVSGKRIDRGLQYPDCQSALIGGLNELRQALGW